MLGCAGLHSPSTRLVFWTLLSHYTHATISCFATRRCSPSPKLGDSNQPRRARAPARAPSPASCSTSERTRVHLNYYSVYVSKACASCSESLSTAPALFQLQNFTQTSRFLCNNVEKRRAAASKSHAVAAQRYGAPVATHSEPRFATRVLLPQRISIRTPCVLCTYVEH